jgi:hypothetical protein
MDFVQSTAGTSKMWKSIHKDNMGGNLIVDEAKIGLDLIISKWRFGGY